MNPAERKAAGRAAEDRAAAYLLGLGYTIVTRRFKSHSGEIDLVALEDEVVVFVEVRSRTTGRLRPEETIDSTKTRALFMAAEEYMRKVYGTPRPFRFDLVAVEGEEVRHHIGAIRG